MTENLPATIPALPGAVKRRSRVARDPVPAAQEKVLALRSGNVCAYPGCSAKLTLRAGHPDDLDKAVGKVAHISAASEGGPRWDKSMTKEQRGSAENLIFLCGTHHDGIDFQLNLHTTEFLVEAKRRHESAVTRAVEYSVGEVGFQHLELVCKGLALKQVPGDEPVNLPLEIDDKLELNKLSESTRKKILIGMAGYQQVESFAQLMNGFEDNFGVRLSAGFKKLYFSGQADGLAGDDLYDYVYISAVDVAGPTDSPSLRAAVLAVLAYLFSLCEIFEHESTAA